MGGLSLGPGADRSRKIIGRDVLARLDSTRLDLLPLHFPPPASATRVDGLQGSEPRTFQHGLCRRVLDDRKRLGLVRLLSLSQISPQWESKIEPKENPPRLGFIRAAVSRGPKLKGRTYHSVLNEVSPRRPDPRHRYKATVWCTAGFPALTLVDYRSHPLTDGLKPDALV